MDLSKRKFIKTGLLSASALAISCKRGLLPAPNLFKGGSNNSSNKIKGEKMTIQLPNLPYSKDALEPNISENTINYHYGKHHKAYVDKLNEAIKGTDLESKSLEEIIKISADNSSMAGIFNNSAQVWNHTFYWNSMSPNGGGKPSGDLLQKIESDFGSFDNFVQEFKNAGATQFGSGWAWLVLDGGKLKVTKTSNAQTPLTTDAIPLLTMDVWEHAYYLDYQNSRPNYIDIFLNKLVNWNFVTDNLKKAL